MTVETTVNIAPDVKKRLDRVAEATGVSRSEIVVKVMRKALKDFRQFVRHDCAVQYQKKNSSSKRKKFHVTLARRDYEYFLDMRKLFKSSVSLLVAFSVNEYLDEVIGSLMDENYDMDTDNYPFQNYLIVPEMVEDVVCWKIYWGIPRNRTKILPSPE